MPRFGQRVHFVRLLRGGQLERAHGQIGGHEGAGIPLQHGVESARKSAHAGERADACRYRQNHEDEPARGSARFAPGDLRGRAVWARLAHVLSHGCRFHRHGLIAHHQTVAQRDDAVRMRGQRGVVRHHHQRRAFPPVEFQQQFEHLLAGLAIQIAGRLIGQQNRRLRDERAGQRHALLLAAGKLHRIVVQAVRQADAREQFPRARGHFRTRARQFRRQQDILFRGQSRNQLERLKNETDLAPAHFRHAVFGKPGNIFAIEQNLAAGGVVEAREQAEQRALAASRRPHDGDELAARDRQIDATQNLDPVGGRLDGPRQPDDFNDGGMLALLRLS